jgi:uncharacterized protein YecE (DUF72 family)
LKGIQGASSGPRVLVGCAGWNVPQADKQHFPSNGSHLVRYASRLPAVEINSSFYRPHRPATYARWGASVPPAFRFSVKMPREITHRLRLVGTESLLDSFLTEVVALGDKLGCLLLQTPPGLGFDRPVAEHFFKALRQRHAGAVAAETRHPSWFTAEAGQMLAAFRIARVAADPPRALADGEPGGSPEIAYYRLHGSPQIYYSSYTRDYLLNLAACFKERAPSARVIWCIFDNTARGAAAANALMLHDATSRFEVSSDK